MLVHAGKYTTEENYKYRDNTATMHSPEKTNKQRITQQNKDSLVYSFLTTLGQETRRAYSITTRAHNRLMDIHPLNSRTKFGAKIVIIYLFCVGIFLQPHHVRETLYKTDYYNTSQKVI